MSWLVAYNAGVSRLRFRKGAWYRATADTFSVPDFPPRWTVSEGEAVGGELVQRIPRGALVRCLGVVPSATDRPDADARIDFRGTAGAAYAYFEDAETGEVYKYQLSLRPLWPWEEADDP